MRSTGVPGVLIYCSDYQCSHWTAISADRWPDRPFDDPIPLPRGRGPTMFARIGIMRALNRNVERTLDPTRKDTHWAKRKLKGAE